MPQLRRIALELLARREHSILELRRKLRRHSGSDAETGWSEDGLTGTSHGLPDEFTDDDYDRILQEIDAAPRKPAVALTLRTALILALVAALAFALIW